MPTASGSARDSGTLADEPAACWVAVVSVISLLPVLLAFILGTSGRLSDAGGRVNLRAFAALCDQIEAAGDPATDGGAIAGLYLAAKRCAVREKDIPARTFDNGGWRFSSLMADDGVGQKIAAFPHRDHHVGGRLSAT